MPSRTAIRSHTTSVLSVAYRRSPTGSANSTPGESVELIFAEQGEYQDRAKTIYGAYMKGKPLAPIQSLRFASMQACAPLQAADMAVYCTNKQMEKALYAKKTKDEIYRSALDVLYWNRGLSRASTTTRLL